MAKRIELSYSPQEVSSMWDLSVGTLANWRWRKKGPKYVRMEGTVRYPVRFLIDYEEKNRINPRRKRNG